MFWTIIGRILWARWLILALVAGGSLAGGLIVVAVALIVSGGGSARADPERPAEDELEETAA